MVGPKSGQGLAASLQRGDAEFFDPACAPCRCGKMGEARGIRSFRGGEKSSIFGTTSRVSKGTCVRAVNLAEKNRPDLLKNRPLWPGLVAPEALNGQKGNTWVNFAKMAKFTDQNPIRISDRKFASLVQIYPKIGQNGPIFGPF